MVKTIMDLVEDARKVIPEITVKQLHVWLDTNKKLILLDVRELGEIEKNGAINDSVSIPRGFLEMKIGKITTDADACIVIYCAAGHRSILAANTLISMGFKDVFSLSGGFSEWIDDD